MPQQGRPSTNNSFKKKPPLNMEIAGMSISVVALVGLFENAITCFTRVRMARSYGPDLNFLMVRFEVLHLRLTRWGEVAGLNKPSEDNKAPSTNLSTSDQTLAKMALEQIKTRFHDATKFLQDIDIGEDVVASATDLGDKKTLVERMRNLSIKRRPRTSAVAKAKWVIYRKDELSSLIRDLSNCLNDLDHVLPAGSASLTPICDEEVGQLFSNEGLHQASAKMLEDVAAEFDGKLADAIARHKTNVSTNARQNSSHSMLIICIADIFRSPNHLQHQQWCQQRRQFRRHSAWRPNQHLALLLIPRLLRRIFV